MMHRYSALLIICVLVAAACGTAPVPVVAPMDGATRASYVLTADDLARPQYGTAYQAVEHLRPEFLRPHGLSPTSQVVIYLNGMKLGGADQLHAIRAAHIAELRYLNTREATLRFGGGHQDGAILVLLAGGKPEAH